MGIDILGSINPTVEGRVFVRAWKCTMHTIFNHACVFPDIKLQIKYSILYIYVVVWLVDTH